MSRSGDDGSLMAARVSLSVAVAVDLGAISGVSPEMDGVNSGVIGSKHEQGV